MIAWASARYFLSTADLSLSWKTMSNTPGKISCRTFASGIAYDEAQTVFKDPLFIDFYDPDHSEDEERYLIVGKSSQGNLLIVSYTERENAIRIISARKVTKAERKAHEEG